MKLFYSPYQISSEELFNQVISFHHLQPNELCGRSQSVIPLISLTLEFCSAVRSRGLTWVCSYERNVYDVRVSSSPRAQSPISPFKALSRGCQRIERLSEVCLLIKRFLTPTKSRFLSDLEDVFVFTMFLRGVTSSVCVTSGPAPLVGSVRPDKSSSIDEACYDQV